MKTLSKLIFSRVLVIALLIVLQLVLLIYGLVFLSQWSVVFYIFLYSLSVAMILWIINHEKHAVYIVSWIILVAFLPVLGGVLYLILGTQGTWKNIRYNLKTIHKRLGGKTEVPIRLRAWLDQYQPALLKQIHYLHQESGAEIDMETKSKYYDNDETMWADLIADLDRAQKFIFLEFFIIEIGQIWEQVVDILERKVKMGVEVRVLFDDAGSIFTLSQKERSSLIKKGIRAQAFNRMRPFLDNRINNRDHRKIVVIDGKIGWTGGFNLADNYANIIKKHGYWYDSGLRLEGRAVWGLTKVFLESWNTDKLQDNAKEIEEYRPAVKLSNSIMGIKEYGLIEVFGGHPYQEAAVNRDAYMNLLQQAEKEVVIVTPYLILDEVMVNCLQSLARSGVRVRMILPRICDHWYTSILNRAGYYFLQKSGVEIYEYVPGFIHAKTCIVDKKTAIIGSTNFDCRSFYAQFEVGVWLWKNKAVADLVRADARLLADSELMPILEPKQRRLEERIVAGVLKILKPLM